jgi:DNA-binding NtrC family response regulator
MDGKDDPATTQVVNSDQAAIESLILFGEDGMSAHSLENRPEIIVGRAPKCDVIVNHPSVSREHVRIARRPYSFVEDLGSKNGTRVGGIILAPGQRAILAPGMLVEFGALALTLKSKVSARSMPAGRRSAGLDIGPRATSMAQLIPLLERFARTDVPILITGETGSGKEITAETIHRASSRAHRPLVRLNCAAFTDSVLESELFGHERGAFTGAVAPKLGLLETASGGTVLLDEIADLSPQAQAKLLRVLEEHKVWRVGAIQSRDIDVRFLAATHQDLEEQVKKGAFRQDLLFRLNAITVTVPPLRQRRDEILTLAEKFVLEASVAMGRTSAPRLSEEVRTLLQAYAWPGNVRELKNTMTRAMAMCDGDELTVAHAGLSSPNAARTPSPPYEAHPYTSVSNHALRHELEVVERRRISAALATCRGNRSQAAKLLGIARNTLAMRIDRFGIDVTRTKAQR